MIVKILQICDEFVGERGQPAVAKNMGGTEILKSEMRSALTKINRIKASVSDGIVIEISILTRIR